MPTIEIRPATPGDAGAISRIYNHYVLESTATFDTEPVSAGDRARWLAEHDEEHPVFVAVGDTGVIGWAALSEYRKRPAWCHTAEVAVYLAPDRTGTGTGSRLLGRLVEAARAAGHHVLISQIVAGNEPSLRMSARAGFERVGTLKEVGRKSGRWLDIELLRLEL